MRQTEITHENVACIACDVGGPYGCKSKHRLITSTYDESKSVKMKHFEIEEDTGEEKPWETCVSFDEIVAIMKHLKKVDGYSHFGIVKRIIDELK